MEKTGATMNRHTFYPDLRDLQPRISKRTAKVLDYATAAAIGLSLAVLVVHHLSK